MLDMTYEQALERIDDTLAEHHPRDLKSREVRCIVIHRRIDGVEPYTFVEARVFTTRGVYGKQKAVRYRFGSLMTLPFAYAEENLEHEAGRCGVCTLRFRHQNQLGVDVSDLPLQLGYMPQSEVEATRRWSADELAKVPARPLASQKGRARPHTPPQR
jgi:hypothetical protein